ncbi:MAG TPA: SDR family oxidoreductase [Terriglobales bacterium]|nr:SDR family oxidoreductase [Terriglobales bacterium]
MAKNKVSTAGQIAIVTGGSKGIGAAVAKALAELGMQVVICGRRVSQLDRQARAIKAAGGKCTPLPCDVGQVASVEGFATEVAKRFSRVDVLVNNAGVGSFSSPLHELDPKEWDRVLDINLKGVYLMIRAFAPLMIAQKSGHIINISSLAGKNALPKGAAYAASKWGLNGLTYSVAEELRENNIRVAVICPGSVNTELSPHAGKDAAKMLQPEDVAHAVTMLVTQQSQSFASEILLRPTRKP